MMDGQVFFILDVVVHKKAICTESGKHWWMVGFFKILDIRFVGSEEGGENGEKIKDTKEDQRAKACGMSTKL